MQSGYENRKMLQMFMSSWSYHDVCIRCNNEYFTSILNENLILSLDYPKKLKIIIKIISSTDINK